MFRNLGKGLLTLAAAGLLSVSFSGQAKAGAVAYSTLQVTNFLALTDDGVTPFDVSDFNFVFVSNTAGAEATLNGVVTAIADVTANGNVNPPLECLGACGMGDNVFGKQVVGTQFSRGDSDLRNAMITGLGPAGVSAKTVAEAQLTSTAQGSASSFAQTGSTVSYQISLVNDGTVRFSLDAIATAFAEVTPDGQFPSTATAGFSWSITINDDINGVQIFEWTPIELQGGATRNFITAGLGSLTNGFAGSLLSSATPVLAADGLYTITINHDTNVNATFVPEPGTLVLLGFGLLGLGAMRRRMKAAA